MKYALYISLFLFPSLLISQTGDAVDDNILMAKDEKRKAELATVLQNGLAKLRIGEKNEDQKIQLEACLEIGAIYERERYHEKALTYYRRAVSLANELGHHNERLEIQSKIAQSLFENQKWEEAYDDSEEIFEQHQIFGHYGPAVKDLERMADCAPAFEQFGKSP